MKNKRLLFMGLATVAVAGYAAMGYLNQHPKSAELPLWIQGEFAASAERYAGRTVSVDTAAITFSHGDGTADVLPIEWIEEVKDARRNIRVLNLHVRDADAQSTIKLIASAEDSSFRLQTMPDVAWRHQSDRDARAARVASRDTASAAAAGPAVVAVKVAEPSMAPEESDTTIGAKRFADRDPAAQDELAQVVKACKVYGCRIGIQGLRPSRYDEFAKYLRGLGADSVTLTTESSASATTFAMLEISAKKGTSMR